MYTLSYKVLLTKTVLLVFIRAIGFYLLFTLPALAALADIYILSAAYAISFGWIAAGLFFIAVLLLQKPKIGTGLKKIILYASVAVCVGIAFQLMEITKVQYNIWHSGFCLLFPGVAVVSGWISIAMSAKKLNMLFQYRDANPFTEMNNPPTPENII